MKNIIKTSLLVGLIGFCCVSCSNERQIYDASKSYNTLWNEQLKYLCSYFPNEKYELFKINSSNLEKKLYEDYIIINSEKRHQIMVSLFDETCWELNNWSGKKKNFKLYFNANKVNEFLNRYDYFYLYATYPRSITAHKKGKETEFSEAFCVEFKKYNLLPFKNNKLKLDELFAFYNNNSVMPYNYELVAEYHYLPKGTENRLFIDFFWNDMSNVELLNSFNQLKENPPKYECERCLE